MLEAYKITHHKGGYVTLEPRTTPKRNRSCQEGGDARWAVPDITHSANEPCTCTNGVARCWANIKDW